VLFSLELEIVRFFEGMQSDYFNIFRRTSPGEHSSEPSSGRAHLTCQATAGTTKDSSLWMKILRFMLP